MGCLLRLNTILQKAKILSVIHLNIWKYNVCCIKLETKVLHLNKIRVMNISLFLVNKYVVHNF